MPAELTAGQELRPLTRRMQLFCQAYAECMVGSKAAKLAGASDGRAKVRACQWLKLPQVKAEVERLQAIKLEELGVTRHNILRTAANIAHSNVLDYQMVLKTGDVSKLTRDQAAAIKKITIEDFEPEEPKKKASLEHQPQGGALQRGSKPEEPPKKKERKLKRRISLELLPKTPAVELLGKHMNLWGSPDPDAAAAGATNVQVNVIFDL